MKRTKKKPIDQVIALARGGEIASAVRVAKKNKIERGDKRLSAAGVVIVGKEYDHLWR